MPSTYAYLVVMSLPELPPLLKRTQYVVASVRMPAYAVPVRADTNTVQT